MPAASRPFPLPPARSCLRAPPRSSSAGDALRLEHFQRIRPVCPACRAAGRTPAPLELGAVCRRDGADDVAEGVLECPQRGCRREHPIIDGVPVIVGNIRSYMSHQLGAVRARSDLSPLVDSLLGDCAGPDSDLDRVRSQLSSYARGHYGDLDPDEPMARAGGLAALFDTAMATLPEPPAGLWLDTGCAVGRATFELARRTGDLALGVDLNFAMLRVARKLARTGELIHPLRRLGIVYDERAFAVAFEHSAQVDFWACDATALPFGDAQFDGVLSFNAVDCIASPIDHLNELARMLRPGGGAVVTTPYDWSTNATPIEAWIGGHSQRSDNRGSGVREMRRLLSPDVPEVAPGLTITAELDAVPWTVYVHERATMTYQLHAVTVRAGAGRQR